MLYYSLSYNINIKINFIPVLSSTNSFLDGSGYVEDGREIFDDEIEEDIYTGMFSFLFSFLTK